MRPIKIKYARLYLKTSDRLTRDAYYDGLEEGHNRCCDDWLAHLPSEEEIVSVIHNSKEWQAMHLEVAAEILASCKQGIAKAIHKRIFGGGTMNREEMLEVVGDIIISLQNHKRGTTEEAEIKRFDMRLQALTTLLEREAHITKMYDLSVNSEVSLSNEVSQLKDRTSQLLTYIDGYKTELAQLKEQLGRLTRENLLQVVPQAYCTKENQHKELDAELLTAIVDIIVDSVKGGENES